MDATTIQIIDEVVGLWISQGRAFTAYEASKEVQARLVEKSLPFTRHQDMRDYYHTDCAPLRDEVTFGSYKMTLIEVGAPEKANLFHPDTYNPDNYIPMPRKGNTGIIPPVVGAGGAVATGAQLPNMIFLPTSIPNLNPPIPNSIAIVAAPVKGVHSVNQGQELWIGSQYLLELGLNPGDSFEVFEEGTGVSIARNAPSGSNVLKTLVVEQKGNSRFSSSAREAFGFKGTSFKFETTNDRILIVEA